MMERKFVEDAGLEVPRIGLGTWALGGWMWGGTEKNDPVKTIHSAIDKGITLIDTAPVYGFGRSEEIVGDAVARYGKRQNVVISTKVGLEWQNGNIARNSSPGRILEEIGDSLRRLRTDYIDIYFVHWPDGSTDFTETAKTMRQLLEDGKIRAIGVSNYSPDQMNEFRKAAPIHVLQPPYNLFERDIENEHMPYCREYGITTMTYGALCRGLLSGKMSKDTEFDGDDLRKHDPKFQNPRYEQYLKAVDRLDRYARDAFNKRVIHLAVRWILDQGVDIALWGARRPDQLEAVEGVMGWELDAAARREIDEIVERTIGEPIGAEFMAPPE